MCQTLKTKSLWVFQLCTIITPKVSQINPQLLIHEGFYESAWAPPRQEDQTRQLNSTRASEPLNYFCLWLKQKQKVNADMAENLTKWISLQKFHILFIGHCLLISQQQGAVSAVISDTA